MSSPSQQILTPTASSGNQEPWSRSVPTRQQLRQAEINLVHKGPIHKADVYLVDLGEGPIAIKDYRLKPWWTRLIGVIQIAHECAAYKVLGHAPGIPRFIGKIDLLALGCRGHLHAHGRQSGGKAKLAPRGQGHELAILHHADHPGLGTHPTAGTKTMEVRGGGTGCRRTGHGQPETERRQDQPGHDSPQCDPVGYDQVLEVNERPENEAGYEQPVYEVQPPIRHGDQSQDARLAAAYVLEHHEQEQHGGEEFHQEIARGYPGAARPALAAKDQEAHQRDVVEPRDLLLAVGDRYALETGQADLTLEFEYKKLAPFGNLVVKQVRRLPEPDDAPSVTPFLIDQPVEYCLFQGEYGDDIANHRLKSRWRFHTRNIWLTPENLQVGLYSNVDLEYTESCLVLEQSGPFSDWPQACCSPLAERHSDRPVGATAPARRTGSCTGPHTVPRRSADPRACPPQRPVLRPPRRW